MHSSNKEGLRVGVRHPCSLARADRCCDVGLRLSHQQMCEGVDSRRELGSLGVGFQESSLTSYLIFCILGQNKWPPNQSHRVVRTTYNKEYKELFNNLKYKIHTWNILIHDIFMKAICFALNPQLLFHHDNLSTANLPPTYRILGFSLFLSGRAWLLHFHLQSLVPPLFSTGFWPSALLLFGHLPTWP